MKILVISDLHLTKHFSQKKFDRLKSVIEKSDKVVLNGDFWDSYFCSFNDFLDSKWSAIFPLLKSKDTFYIFGNHDLQKFSDNRIKEFCTEFGDSLDLTLGDKAYHIEHGHIIAGYSPDKSKFQMKVKGILSYLEFPMVKIFGPNLQKWYAYSDNKKIAKFAEKRLRDNQYLVCGHTHYQEFRENVRYINSGFCRFSYFEYLIIDEKGFKLIKENK